MAMTCGRSKGGAGCITRRGLTIVGVRAEERGGELRCLARRGSCGFITASSSLICEIISVLIFLVSL